MGTGNFMELLGGLALFLHGMERMAEGLSAAGDGMRRLLARFASGRLTGMLFGATVTAALQSSSAVTVMAVGFVDSGILTLRQAVWIIMGANIGTTATAGLVALDAGAAAPAIAFAGVVMAVFIRKPRISRIGGILSGLGILFLGMEMMGGAMLWLKKSPAFLDAMAGSGNPLSGILAGAAFAAAVQSSSAAVGILQALAGSVIPFSSAAYVVFGQNIGTCVTAALASAGMGRNAKRAALVHFFFNVIGTALFTCLCMFTPLLGLIAAAVPGNGAAQVAILHALFNVGTAFALIPFGDSLAILAERLLP